ncbi:MAG: hypothetical protein PVF83_19115 [Anaerolineales bacterium]
MDEETVEIVLVRDSLFAGDGSIPRTPLLGGNCFPQTPSMNCDVCLLDILQHVLG